MSDPRGEIRWILFAHRSANQRPHNDLPRRLADIIARITPHIKKEKNPVRRNAK
jgi:hypothetical protein